MIGRPLLLQILSSFPKDEEIIHQERERRMTEMKKKGYIKERSHDERTMLTQAAAQHHQASVILAPRATRHALSEGMERTEQLQTFLGQLAHGKGPDKGGKDSGGSELKKTWSLPPCPDASSESTDGIGAGLISSPTSASAAYWTEGLEQAIPDVILKNNKLEPTGKIVPLKGMERKSFRKRALRNVW